MGSKYTLVQLKLLPQTIEKVRELQAMLDLNSRTETVKTAVYLAHTVVSAMQKGEEVTIGGKRVIIPGVGKAFTDA